MRERLQKIIARSGICSRRASEDLLRAGRVCVNGRIASLGESADREQDVIEIDGKQLTAPPEFVYLMLHKPRGCVTTLSDECGRKTAAQLVENCGTRVFPVGRLDMDSEGLLLFTNDGALMQRLIHPSGEVRKTYHVCVHGTIEGAAERLAAIRDLDGEKICPAQVRLLEQNSGEAVMEIVIHEGKNRQVRRMCRKCGLTVSRLVRVAEGPLTLGSLKPGEWRYLNRCEVAALKGDDKLE